MATVEDYLKNAKWVKRLSEFFHQCDLNKDGHLSREDWLIGIDNLAAVITDRPALIAKLREVSLEYAAGLGLTEGVKVDRQKFLECAAAMAVAETAKVKSGGKSLLEMVDNAGFDVVDQNHDGHVTFEEYKVMMNAYHFDLESAEATFAVLDKNKNGKLERNEFTSANVKFWFQLDDPDSQGMFGAKFE